MHKQFIILLGMFLGSHAPAAAQTPAPQIDPAQERLLMAADIGIYTERATNNSTIDTQATVPDRQDFQWMLKVPRCCKR